MKPFVSIEWMSNSVNNINRCLVLRFNNPPKSVSLDLRFNNLPQVVRNISNDREHK